VYCEISKAVKKNSYAHRKAIFKNAFIPQYKQSSADSGVEDKECIISLEPTFFGLVMVSMQRPQKSMHHIFMGKPSHKLHSSESENANKYVEDDCHGTNLSLNLLTKEFRNCYLIMINPLMRWFLFWLGLMILGLLLFGIFGPKGRVISIEDVSFKTNQSSELYFKNMRSYFYDIEEHEESGYLMYRLGSRDIHSNKLSFVILRNWKMGESYILIESDLFETKDEEILIET
jgi:hypothetical protein